MMASEFSNSSNEFHEVEITIHIPGQYAEILEIHRETEDGPVIVQVTSIKVFESQDSYISDFNHISGRNVL